jgi:hydroxymethylpyrimidine/phosphomethylpyrimidine kinase
MTEAAASVHHTAEEREAALWFFAGHDPSGGAGIQADLEVAAAFDLPAVSLITASTVQNSQGVFAVSATPAAWLAAQLAALVADFPPPKGIKISVIGSAENVQVIVDFLQKVSCPVVFDPILRAGAQGDLQSHLREAIVETLLPKVTLLTPNLPELLALACGESERKQRQHTDFSANADLLEYADLSAKAAAVEAALLQAIKHLQSKGIKGIFLTGGHHGEAAVLVNRLFWQEQGEIGRWTWPRLAGAFHGSGCTLAAALLCALSQQTAPWPQATTAWAQAQAFTYQSLQTARPLGKNQRYPRRPGRC